MNEDSMKELERLRKQISQQEKMASLGLLSAGIAHEIQNPLNFVINFSKLSCKLLQDMEDVLDELESKLSAEVDEEIREIMDDLKSNMCKIEENGNRASSIVRGILLYSRSMVLYFGLCSLIRLHSKTSASSSESVMIYSKRAICFTICAFLIPSSWLA